MGRRWTCHQKILPKASFEKHGRGGHSGLTTPSAPSMNGAIFLMRSHPSCSRRGLIRARLVSSKWLGLIARSTPHGAGFYHPIDFFAE